MEEATFLTKFASKVTIVHRRDTLRASKIMQDKAFENPKIDFVWNSEIEDIQDMSKGFVTSVLLRDIITGERSDLPVDGVFIAIGHTPNTALFRGQLEMDANGYIITTRARTPACRASSRAATCRTTSTDRRLPRRARAAWPPSTPSTTSTTSRKTSMRS